jgi:hypothetical protein
MLLNYNASTAGSPLLNRWAFHRSVTAKHATVTFFWLKYCMTICAIIEKLARIGWHDLFFFITAIRASYYGLHA